MKGKDPPNRGAEEATGCIVGLITAFDVVDPKIEGLPELDVPNDEWSNLN